jgi:hypothetical protein
MKRPIWLLAGLLLLIAVAHAQTSNDTVTITVTPPTGAPAAPTVTPRCPKTIKADPPDTSGGWSIQVRDGNANLATVEQQHALRARRHARGG